jgi:hypothetical protein
MESETFWRWFDRGARVDFAATIVSWFFDWKTYALGAVGAIVGAILPKLDNWPFTAIFLVMLVAFAVVALLYLAFCVFLDRRAANRKIERPAAIEAPAVIPRAEVELVPDTDPRELYFQILKDSEWKRTELRKTTNTTHLRSDWLDIRLSEQVHEALLNSKLASRGKECLQGTETTPEHPIPAKTWRTVKILFDDSLGGCAAFEKGRVSFEKGRMAWVWIKFSKPQFFQLFPLGTSPSIDRVPCTELFKMAEAEGWDFSHDSLHLLDMQKAMRQGGVDQTLTIWGRMNKWTSEELMRNESLLKIPADHWHDHFVTLFDVRAGDNFNTFSWLPKGQQSSKGYLDLHVERSQAAEWLRRDAVSFKGKTRPR